MEKKKDVVGLERSGIDVAAVVEADEIAVDT